MRAHSGQALDLTGGRGNDCVLDTVSIVSAP